MTIHDQTITENPVTVNITTIDIQIKPAILLLYPSAIDKNIPLTYSEIEDNLVICCRRYNLKAYKLITGDDSFDFTAIQELIKCLNLSEVTAKDKSHKPKVDIIIEQNILAFSTYSLVWSSLGTLLCTKLIELHIYDALTNTIRLFDPKSDLLVDAFFNFQQIVEAFHRKLN